MMGPVKRFSGATPHRNPQAIPWEENPSWEAKQSSTETLYSSPLWHGVSQGASRDPQKQRAAVPPDLVASKVPVCLIPAPPGQWSHTIALLVWHVWFHLFWESHKLIHISGLLREGDRGKYMPQTAKATTLIIISLKKTTVSIQTHDVLVNVSK